MLKIFKEEPTFRFIHWRFLAFALSGLIILAGVYVWATRGFNWGIDFSGGTLIEVGFDRGVAIPQLRGRLSAIGLGDAQITRIGGEDKFFIKTLAALKRQGRPAGEKLEAIEEYEIVAREIRTALMDEGERAQAAAGRIDLNNSAAGRSPASCATRASATRTPRRPPISSSACARAAPASSATSPPWRRPGSSTASSNSCASRLSSPSSPF